MTSIKEGCVLMSKRKNKKIDLNNIKPEDKLKYEIASELGYLDRVLSDGWQSLTDKESGRIGGIMTKRKREEAKKQQEKLQDDKGQDEI